MRGSADKMRHAVFLTEHLLSKRTRPSATKPISAEMTPSDGIYFKCSNKFYDGMHLYFPILLAATGFRRMGICQRAY
ncbi:unnamed protein product [Protopolystoma xenopodis]|uniref:Uncharacterized protein n=1 Tax=Protopolystoma xenopodis TaxID=117903 RepID=A0A3S5FH62_9PLAT|nr:unnamed protein product [Protopolystoma xenopodis]